jgi:periplasmic serine protease, Do/DeqQ family
MQHKKLFRSLLTVAALAGGATAAVLTLGTSAPHQARADIPAPVLAQAGPQTPPLQRDYQGSPLPSLAPMLKTVLPSVVNVAVSGKVAVHNPMMQDPFFRHFFNVPNNQPQTQEFQAIGSGVIVDADHGYILTNNHVVANATTVRVKLKDGRTFKAKVVGHDPSTDIAVIKIDAKHLTALPIADSTKAEVGDFVVAIGDPFGIGQTVTSGIVSALGRVTNDTGYQDFIQTDASINPGNSGGALVNLRGQLIGINSEILSRSGGNMGIGFAIPSNLARNVMDQLIKYGKVSHGQIGVIIQNLTPDLAKALGATVDRGVVISRVLPDSPAHKAGLKSEDIIIAANGTPIHDGTQLRNIVGLERVGTKVDLTVLRKGEKKDIEITVGKVGANSAGGSGDDLFPALQGGEYASIDSSNPVDGQSRGVVVKAVQSNSPAEQSGLQPKDVIVSANQHAVNNYGDLVKYAGKDQSQVLLRVLRGNGALFLLLQK